MQRLQFAAVLGLLSVLASPVSAQWGGWGGSNWGWGWGGGYHCPPPSVAQVIPLGAGCGAPVGIPNAPGNPVLTATAPVLGGKVRVAVHSDLGPHVPTFIFASFTDRGSFANGGNSQSCGGGTSQAPYFFDPVCGCTVYVDVCNFPDAPVFGDGTNWIVLFEGVTDADGDLYFTFDAGCDRDLIGRQLNLQVRMCGFVNGFQGCYQGVDYLSNGLGLVFGETLGGTQGKTPCFWTRHDVRRCWPAPYTRHTLFSDVFEDAFPGMTLFDVLCLEGNGLNGLGREAVAALLNAAEAGISYELEVAEIVDLFNAAASSSSSNRRDLRRHFSALNCLGGGRLTNCPRCW